MHRTLAATAVLAPLWLSWLVTPVAAHGARTGEHSHLLPVVVFLGSVVVLAASLLADHFDVIDRSRADVGVVGSGLGIVLSLALLWL